MVNPMRTTSLIILSACGLLILGLTVGGEYAGAAFLACLLTIILGVNHATRPR